jgi:hypothetical protein
MKEYKRFTDPLTLKGDKMKTTKLLLICIFCAIGAQAVWGQAANSQAQAGVLGFLDPHTGVFRPVAPAAEADADLAAAATTFTGRVNVTLTITLKTAGLTNITCSLELSTVDGGTTASPRFFAESNSVLATGTGTRTCNLSIPYSWGLTTQSSDNMTSSYTVVGSAGTTGLPQRSSTMSPLDTRKVPANGTITGLTANVTL